MTVRVGDWLQEQGRRGYLRVVQVQAAQMWAADLLELGSALRSNRMDRTCRAEAPPDIMRVAISRRVAAAERKLGGKGGPIYQATHKVAVEGGTAGEVAVVLGIRTTSAMDLIRLGLSDLADVYQMREQQLTG